MINKILLATFSNKENCEFFFKNLEKNFSVKKENTFIFSLDDGENLMITYKINSTQDFKEKIKLKLRNTIQIHKKGECFYSINGLNKLIKEEFNLPEGKIDFKTYVIDWDKYQNKLILVKDDNLHVQTIKKIIL